MKLKRVVIREEIFALTKDTFEAIILGQLIYWQEKVKDFDKFIIEESERKRSNGEEDVNISLQNGWIYKSAKQLIEECMLTISEVTVRRYLQNLINKKFVDCRKNPLNKWDRKLQYRVNMSLIILEIQKLGYDGLSEYSLLKQQKEETNLQNESSSLQYEGAIADTIIETTNNKIYKDKSLYKKKRNVKAKINWRGDYNVYLQECKKAFDEVARDSECEKVLRVSYPNMDYYRTVLKSYEFWKSERGWDYKKKSKSVAINMSSTLKRNLEKNIVYENSNNVHIENELKLSLKIIDDKGTLEDGTIFKDGYRYYHSLKDDRDYSIPVVAPSMPDTRWEYDMNKGWYLPENKETLDDLLW